MVHTRHDLVRKAIEKALKGDNTMLIFCLKNLCGWKDRNEPDYDRMASAFPALKYDPKQLKNKDE